MRTLYRLSGAVLLTSVFGLTACSSGMQSSPSNVVPGAAKTSGQTKQIAYIVRLTPQHRVIVVNATSVAVRANDVNIRYTSGATESLHGQTPTVTQGEVTYTKTPGGLKPEICRFPGPGCGCPPFTLTHYDQATDYREVNNGAGLDYYYDLFWTAPAYDDYVGGVESDSWSGTYADGTTFSYTYGPENWYPGYSSTSPSGMDFDGGPSQDYIVGNVLRLDYTDMYNNTWDAYGTKGRARC